ncbi:MAG: carbohydrate kinase family protein [Candidatus Bathyarchaeia archaeon]
MDFEIVSVGHFSIDSINLPNRQLPYIILGGSVAYVSLSARRLGANVSIISKVGEDFPEAYLWWLSQEGIDISNVAKIKHEKTTRFELNYNGDLSSRILRLTSRSPSIEVEDLPNSLEAKAVHLAPIANEIPYEVAEKLAKSAEIISLDPQGLVRVFDENGLVANESLKDKRMLELIDVYKSSRDEIEAVTGVADLKLAIKTVHDFGVEIVIVTLGMKGAVLSIGGAIYEIPAYTPNKLIDPTGAGDAFIGGFLAEYVRSKEALWCACVGSALASTIVEGVGPTFLGDENEIYRRASVLYEKGIKH